MAEGKKERMNERMNVRMDKVINGKRKERTNEYMN
jgi:hypothetical protein